jgi:hypothetical protein
VKLCAPERKEVGRILGCVKPLRQEFHDFKPNIIEMIHSQEDEIEEGCGINGSEEK